MLLPLSRPLPEGRSNAAGAIPGDKSAYAGDDYCNPENGSDALLFIQISNS
jgi:hypothetical protein